MTEAQWETVRTALEVAREKGYAEVSLREGEMTFAAVLEPAAKKRTASPATATVDVETGPVLAEVVAPLVGYFRKGRTPLEVGATIQSGDHVGVIEALGLATEVEAAVSGEVTEILVEDGQPVMFGQVLARVQE